MGANVVHLLAPVAFAGAHRRQERCFARLGPRLLLHVVQALGRRVEHAVGLGGRGAALPAEEGEGLGVDAGEPVVLVGGGEARGAHGNEGAVLVGRRLDEAAAGEAELGVGVVAGAAFQAADGGRVFLRLLKRVLCFIFGGKGWLYEK